MNDTQYNDRTFAVVDILIVLCIIITVLYYMSADFAGSGIVGLPPRGYTPSTEAAPPQSQGGEILFVCF